MKDKPTIIKRGKLIYVLYAESVVVGSTIGMPQWTSYNQYYNWNRQGINKFRQIIKNSKEDEYTTLTDQMSLAVQCGIKGTGTSQPKEIE